MCERISYQIQTTHAVAETWIRQRELHLRQFVKDESAKLTTQVEDLKKRIAILQETTPEKSLEINIPSMSNLQRNLAESLQAEMDLLQNRKEKILLAIEKLNATNFQWLAWTDFFKEVKGKGTHLCITTWQPDGVQYSVRNLYRWMQLQVLIIEPARTKQHIVHISRVNLPCYSHDEVNSTSGLYVGTFPLVG